MNCQKKLSIRLRKPCCLIASVALLLTCLPNPASAVQWLTSLAEAKTKAAKTDFPIGIWWLDGSGAEDPITPKGRFGDLEKHFIWVRVDKTKDAAGYNSLGLDTYFEKGGKTHSTPTMHKTSGYAFMNAKGDIYARLPGNQGKNAPNWFDQMLMAVCRRHYGPEKFYVDSGLDTSDSGGSVWSCFGRPKKMSGKVTTPRKTPTELHTWKTCDICKGFLEKAIPYIEAGYSGGNTPGMLGGWPANAALTMYGKKLDKEKYLKDAQKQYTSAAIGGGYWNWVRAANGVGVAEYALQHGLTPEFEKILVDTQQEASEYIDECMGWFHYPRRGGRNYSSKQGLIGSMFHATFVEMEFMGLEAEPGMSLARANQGRFAYGSSDVAGKTGLQVAALYATGWADDPFTRFSGDPMLTGGDNPKGLNYPRANFPGYGHGHASWVWMGCAVALHRMTPAGYAEWADLWVHPLISLQRADGGISQLPNDAFPEGPHAVGDDAMPYIKKQQSLPQVSAYDATTVVTAIVLMTEPGAYWGLPIKPKGSLPNKEAFSKGNSAMRTSDHATAYANFAIVLPPGDNLELVYQARIHMRELQIKLCPDRAERRKRARKIASFSAEKRAKAEIAIYAKGAKAASSRKSRAPAPVARQPKKDSVANIDKLLLGKLEALAKSGGLPKKPLVLRLSRAKLSLKGASKADRTISLGASGKVKKMKVSDLGYIDRATIASVLSLQEPDNKGLYGVTAFYLECSGKTKIAATYYEKAGKEMKVKFTNFFEAK